uniref:alpha-galactosidase n=1 Tax=Coprococcus sp. TaxID=2049024 RepID=UPI0040283E39
MGIIFHEETKTFHLTNGEISYIMTVLPNGHLGNLYYGKAIRDREDFSHLLELVQRPMFQYVYDDDRLFSLESVKQELPVYGTTDYRAPMVEVLQSNGSRISDFVYVSHEVNEGKPKLEALPATYTENDDEAETLIVTLKDSLTGIKARMLYTIWSDRPVIAKSVEYINEGTEVVHLTTAYSMCLDLPDPDYQWMQLSGAWARERHIITRDLEQGVQSIGSNRGHSSHEHNPFIVLKRETTDENQGEAIGISLVYSGNFKIQAEVDTRNTARILAGINPDTFDWKLDAGEHFQTPEAVIVYSDQGLNKMSQTFHKLYQKRLARGEWRDKPRPILINNWEATYFDFTREKLIAIAQKAKECGVELFVLDDGWFGARTTDHAGLGDWVANPDRLPEGITGIAEDIEKVGLKFGLWFEPEMTNKDSDLYREHPDWILSVPGRHDSHGRFQYVLDFSRKEVVDRIYEMMAKILSTAKVSYVKWDMNRSITECYSAALPADRQGEVFHRYILGVYDLYERLTSTFPHVLFESCASGGGRFDPGILYYAPQGWTSDDTDAIERVKIQYGTSMCYPISSMGSHVSVVPNHQTRRETPLKTRANAAYFGTFGYELDLNKLTAEEIEEVKEQVKFMKAYREVIQYGTFYRLASPFDDEECGWMVVSDDKKTAIVAWFRTLYTPNKCFTRMKLHGLDPDAIYSCNVLGGQALTVSKTPDGKLIYEKVSGDKGEDSAVNVIAGPSCYGDELMNLGLITSDTSAGEIVGDDVPCGDYDSRLYVLKAE